MTTIIIYTVASQVEEVAGIMRDNMEKVLFNETIITIMITMMMRMLMLIHDIDADVNYNDDNYDDGDNDDEAS